MAILPTTATVLTLHVAVDLSIPGCAFCVLQCIAGGCIASVILGMRFMLLLASFPIGVLHIVNATILMFHRFPIICTWCVIAALPAMLVVASVALSSRRAERDGA